MSAKPLHLKRFVGIAAAALIFVSVFVGGAIWFQVSGAPLLLPKATRIAAPSEFSWYAWEGDHRLLVGAQARAKTSIWRVNTESGSFATDSRLEQILRGKKPYRWNLSPDGRLLFVRSGYQTQDLPTIYEVNSDHKITCPRDIDTNYTHWLPQSNGLASASVTEAGMVINVFRIDKQILSSVTIPALNLGFIVGAVDDDTLVFLNRLQDPPNQLEVLRVSISRKSVLTRKAIYFPDDADIFEDTLSPDGRTVAMALWKRNRDLKNSYPFRLIDRWIPDKTEWQLFVIDVQTNRTRTVGRVSVTNDMTPTPHSIKWHPDSRHITFVCNGQLYRCSATIN